MKLVIQRVKKAKVSVIESGEVVGEIGNGLFVLVGVGKEDTEEIAARLADKLLKMRLMADGARKMNLSVLDARAALLVVSQFTLYADISGGNRPSFIDAALPDHAEKIYDFFLATLRKSGVTIETGSFGEYMEIITTLDGPVTIGVAG